MVCLTVMVAIPAAVAALVAFNPSDAASLRLTGGRFIGKVLMIVEVISLIGFALGLFETYRVSKLERDLKRD